jgi:cation transport ATPase
MNLEGVLDIEATSVGADSTLAQIVRTVEQAMARRTDVERAVDRVSRHFIPAVLGVAVLTGAAFGLMRAIDVVVIACPCALGIATPLALSAGWRGRAAAGPWWPIRARSRRSAT